MGDQIKDEKQYEALLDQGMSKEKAARIASSGKEASKKGGKHSAYEEWTKEDLMKKAAEVGIEGRSKMDKEGLIEVLRNH